MSPPIYDEAKANSLQTLSSDKCLSHQIKSLKLRHRSHMVPLPGKPMFVNVPQNAPYLIRDSPRWPKSAQKSSTEPPSSSKPPPQALDHSSPRVQASHSQTNSNIPRFNVSFFPGPQAIPQSRIFRFDDTRLAIDIHSPPNPRTFIVPHQRLHSARKLT